MSKRLVSFYNLEREGEHNKIIIVQFVLSQLFFFLLSCTAVSLIVRYRLFPSYFCTVFMSRGDCQHCIFLRGFHRFSLVFCGLSVGVGAFANSLCYFRSFRNETRYTRCTRTYLFSLNMSVISSLYATHSFNRLWLSRSVLLICMPSYRNR